MLLVFGTRPMRDPHAADRYALGVRDVLDRVLDATPPTTLLEGGSRGPDLWARHLAGRADRVAAGWATRSEEVSDEEWAIRGRAAGPERNARMAAILRSQGGTWSRLAVGFWDGVSNGSRSMIRELYRVGIAPFVFHVPADGRVSWPRAWRSVEVTDDEQLRHRIVFAGTDARDARVVLSPWPDLLTLRWAVVYRERDAAEWSFGNVQPYEGWPTVAATHLS